MGNVDATTKKLKVNNVHRVTVCMCHKAETWTIKADKYNLKLLNALHNRHVRTVMGLIRYQGMASLISE